MSKQTLCSRPWDIPIYYPYHNSFSYCSKTPKIKINIDLLRSLGDNFWSNHPNLIERRRSLLEGIKHTDCEVCWKLEDKGFKSARNVEEMHYFMRRNITNLSWNTEWEEFKDIPNIEYSNYTNALEIFLNNTCDAKCTYCNEEYSSQWETEKRKFGEIKTFHPKVKSKEIEESFWNWYSTTAIKTVRRVGFIGGEPLIQEELYECFDKLINIHSNNGLRSEADLVEIYIVSNLNTPPSLLQKFLDYTVKLKKYFKIKLQISGEALGNELEYIRYGVKFEIWKHNIHRVISNSNLNVAFQPVISLLSLPTLSNYLNFFHQICKNYKFIKLHYNMVSYPLAQSPLLAYKDFVPFIESSILVLNEIILDDIEAEKQRIKSYIKFKDGLEKIKTAIKDKEINYSQAAIFYNYFSNLDQKRNTKVFITFPFFLEMYNKGAKGDH